MSVLSGCPKTQIVEVESLDALPFRELAALNSPVIVKNIAGHWPIVEAGKCSHHEVMRYLEGFYSGRPVTLYTLAPEHQGQPFYDENLTRMNYTAERVPLQKFFDLVRETFDIEGLKNGYYVGSTDQNQFFPGLDAENGLKLETYSLFEIGPVLSSLWMGGQTTARAHYDMSNNIAFCVAGKRRFILFPPDQIHNLYPGPLAPTPGGQVLTMVDIHKPDFEKYPKFEEAIKHAQIAELEPGDMLMYPALWWHQVEALAQFNILLNYWWNSVPSFADSPMNTLLHGLISLRDRPQSEKDAWREVFDYYVFKDGGNSASHLPEHARGPLGEMDGHIARQLRAQLLQKLNR